MVMSVKVTGISELGKKLDRLSGDEQENIIETAFEKGANTLLQTAQQLCPVKTGQLRQSLEVKTTNRKGAISCKVGISGGGMQYKGQQWYGAPVELGHYAGKRGVYAYADNKHKPTGRTWVDGKHFMRQAAQVHKTDVPAQIVADIQAGIERLAND